MMQTPPPETMLPKEPTDTNTKTVEVTSIESKTEDCVATQDKSPKVAIKELDRKVTVTAGNGGEAIDIPATKPALKAKTPEAIDLKAKTAEKPTEKPVNSKDTGSVQNSKGDSGLASSEKALAEKTEGKASEPEEPMEIEGSGADKRQDDRVEADSVEAKHEKPTGTRGRKRKAEGKEDEVDEPAEKSKRAREASRENVEEKRTGRKRAAKTEASMKEAAGSEDEDYEAEEQDEDEDDDEPRKRKRGRGRGRPPKSSKPAATKQARHTGPTLDIPTVEGKTTACSAGEGEVGQLGIGEEGESGKSRFVAIGDIPGKVVRGAAGGMHSLLLTDKGEVYSFGCNDDGSLGRATENEEDCFVPKLTPLPEPVAKIAAGNVHSAAITTKCKVFIWGSYRDNNGSFGIQPESDAPLRKPTELKVPETIVDIACGSEHTLLLSNKGNIFSMGCGEQGRLGRLKSSHCSRENRRARQTLLNPVIVPVRKRKIVKFDRVWAGRYTSFARSVDGAIWGCGLNNYGQLGEVDARNMEDNFVFFMVELKSFDSKIQWQQISGGEQHTLALDADGSVYSMGRVLYGRLGLGEKKADDPDVKKPTLIPNLGKKCTLIATGDHTSFALDKDGQLWSWGQGANLLGQGSRDDADQMDVFVPTLCTSKALRELKIVHVCAGSNHSLCVKKTD